MKPALLSRDHYGVSVIHNNNKHHHDTILLYQIEILVSSPRFAI
jgi:hypothetical protein